MSTIEMATLLNSSANTVYLNTAATSWPKPTAVIDHMTTVMRDEPIESGRSSSPQRADLVAQTRARFASFIGANNPDRVVFTPGATGSLNMAIFGALTSHARLATSESEHNSVLRPLAHITKRFGNQVTHLPCENDGSLSVETLSASLADGIDVFVITHRSNVTGATNDIAGIKTEVRRRGGITVVDASQSIGVIGIDVERDALDVVAFACHKHLFGPSGIGALWVRDGIDLEPLLVGGTGVLSESVLQPQHMPLRLESGTHNIPGIAGLYAAIDLARHYAQSHSRRILVS